MVSGVIRNVLNAPQFLTFKLIEPMSESGYLIISIQCLELGWEPDFLKSAHDRSFGVRLRIRLELGRLRTVGSDLR